MTLRTSLIISGDSASARQAVNDLDNSMKIADSDAKRLGATSGALASQMAVSAQASARAATGVASAGMAAANARIAMLDMTHVGINMTQMLASGVNPMHALVLESGRLATAVQYSSGGIGGLVKQAATWLGLIKVTRDAELAEEAANAAASAQSIRGAAQRTASAIAAADTELALAQAAVRTAATSEAEAAAQAQLAAAHEAVAAAAAQAAVAEDALAVAMGREAEASAAAGASTRVMIGGTGVGLLGIAAVAGIAYGAIKRFQDQVKDSGALDRFAETSRLSAEQIEKLGGKVDYTGHNVRTVTGLTVTFGDVMAGVFQEIAKEANDGSAWDNFKSHASGAFGDILDFWNKTSAAISAGLWTLGDIAKDVFQYIAQKIGQSFYDGVNKAIDALNGLNAKIPKWAGGGDPNLIPHLKQGPKIPDLGTLGSLMRSQADKNYADALAANNAAYAGIKKGAVQHGLGRLSDLSDTHNPPKGPKARKQSDHGLGDALKELDAQIKGQRALAAAYGISDAEVIKAEALQKAEEQAIRHKGEVGVFYEKELQLAVAQGLVEGAKRVADMKAETSARQRVNAMVAQGIIPASQANDQLQLENELRPLQARLQLADAKTRQELLKIIHDTIQAHKDLNAQLSEEQFLRDKAANDNDIEQLRLEATLIGASNRERAVAIAQLQAQQKLRDMPGLSPEQQQNYIQSYIDKANASVRTPFQEWADSIPQTAAAVTDAFQNIEFKGIDQFVEGIDLAKLSFKGLGELILSTGQSILTMIVQMTLKMLFFRAISGAIGGGVSDSQLGGVDVSGYTGPLDGSSKGNVFSHGSIIPHRDGGVVSQFTLFPMSDGRTGSMAEDGPEAIMPLTRDSSGRLGVRSSASGGQPSLVEIRISGGDLFQAEVTRISGNVAVQVVDDAAPRIAKSTGKAVVSALTKSPLP